jgi:hypothetical protein
VAGSRRARAALLSFGLPLLGAVIPSPAVADDAGNHWSDRIATPVELLRLWWSSDQTIQARSHAVTISSDESVLRFSLAQNQSFTIDFNNGRVLIDGNLAGRYPAGGALETAWRQLAMESARLSTAEVVTRLHEWQPIGVSREEAVLAAVVRSRSAPLSAAVQVTNPVPHRLAPAGPGGLVIDLHDLNEPSRLEPLLLRAASEAGPDQRVTVPGGEAELGPWSLGAGEKATGPLLIIGGDADVFGTLEGNLATVNGSVTVHRGGIVTGDVLAVGGDVNSQGGEIRGEIRTLRGAPARPVAAAPAPRPGEFVLALHRAAGLAGICLALLTLGFAAVLFGREPLEIVSDTITHSFGRAFVVGVLGQVLLVPTFGMLVVGLVLSVAGILLVPFVVVVYLLLAVLALAGGAIAVTHAMGETWTRRRMALGVVIGSPNSYRYLLAGLAVPVTLWAAWVLFGWVPVAGGLILGAASITTWLLLTVGFGATLLSRGGLRAGFAGRLLPQEALTDEYLWATPQFGVTAIKRPGSRTPPPLP